MMGKTDFSVVDAVRRGVVVAGNGFLGAMDARWANG
jgi:hypothetical protein